MAKRFTDTNIWDKPWFTKLSSTEKCAINYIKDKCDNVGVWIPHYELAEFLIGQSINWEELPKKTNGNIVILKNGKWWMKDFCRFQYGELDERCRPHASYIRLLKQHGLWNEKKGYPKGIYTHKEKDKEKELEKDKEKEREIPYRIIVEYLNEKAHTSFKPSTRSTCEKIHARWKEDYRLDDFKHVIDIKSFQWLRDDKMSGFLRPETLFGPKFESYLSEWKFKQQIRDGPPPPEKENADMLKKILRGE